MEEGYQYVPKSFVAKEFEFLDELLTDPVSNLCDVVFPLAFAAKHRDEDTPLYHEAMRGPYRDGYRDAMRKEVEQLEERRPGKWCHVQNMLR